MSSQIQSVHTPSVSLSKYRDQHFKVRLAHGKGPSHVLTQPLEQSRLQLVQLFIVASTMLLGLPA